MTHLNIINECKDRPQINIGRVQVKQTKITCESSHEQIVQTGTIVKVKWEKDDVEGTGWSAGWYKAQVQTYCTESDQIQLVYFTEPESVYTLEVTPELYAGKLILVKPVVK